MTDGDERVRPWRWPVQWFRDEKFWRDVASRTASGLLVALLVYLFAVLNGYVRKPALIPVGFVLVGLFIIYLWWRSMWRKWNRMYVGENPTWAQEQGEFDPRQLAWVAGLFCYWVGGITLLVIFYGSGHK